MTQAIAAGAVCTGDAMLLDAAVVFEGDRIVAVVPVEEVSCPLLRLPLGVTLAPGLLDLQVNGGGGVLFNDAIDPSCISRITKAHLGTGTTGLLPTLISPTRAEITAGIAAVHACSDESVLGIHIEGPFINPSRHGIHPAERIIAFTDNDLSLLRGDRILVTLAPECVPRSAIARLAAAGVIVFAGHTDADYDTLCDAVAAGVTGFTHVFNAMSQLGSRAPGAVGTALHLDVYATLIVDGVHVHPTSLALALRCKRADRAILVSDAMATAASALRDFAFAGKHITLSDNRLADENLTLAGAHLTMADAVRNCVALLGLPLERAIRMATANPADALGLADRGRLGPGMRADLVAFDDATRVIGVWQGGRRVPF